VAWRDLPERFGPWQTVWKRHHRFATDGTWDKLLRVIQAEADAAGRVDWNVLPLLAHLRVQRTIGRPRTRPDRVLADKAYSSRAIRAHLRTRGIGSVIPEPDDQKAYRKRIGSSGGRPVTYDRTAYRGRTPT
jgi:transposase